jgi:hypothetical protein
MKVSAMQKSTSQIPDLFESGEPILVTRQVKISGLYVPLKNPDQVPSDLLRDLLTAVGRSVSEIQEAKVVSEEEILEDFGVFRRRRR